MKEQVPIQSREGVTVDSVNTVVVPGQRPLSVRHVLPFIGMLGGSGGLAYAIVEYFHADPDKSYTLLHAWGPWAFIVAFCIYCVDRWINRGLTMAESFGTGVVGALEKNAEQMQKIASAQQQVAEKSDRDMQEMQTTVAYTSQETERMAVAVHRIEELSSDNGSKMSELLGMLKSQPQVDISQVVVQAIDEHERRKAQGA